MSEGPIKGRILIVDDSPSVVHVVTRFLGRRGYAVLSAGTAEDGVRLAGQGQADLILLDDGLPDRLGLLAIGEFKRVCKAPVILVTGYDSQDIRVNAARLGACAFLPKPLELERLLGVIEEVLRKA